jgi:hypothetical protein
LLGRIRTVVFHGEICRGIVWLLGAARSLTMFWEMLGSDHSESKLLLWTWVRYSSPPRDKRGHQIKYTMSAIVIRDSLARPGPRVGIHQ